MNGWMGNWKKKILEFFTLKSVFCSASSNKWALQRMHNAILPHDDNTHFVFHFISFDFVSDAFAAAAVIVTVAGMHSHPMQLMCTRAYTYVFRTKWNEQQNIAQFQYVWRRRRRRRKIEIKHTEHATIFLQI